jgi:predicted porin
MQKKLIALAIAGLASGAAFAQSNVTVYGVVDASAEVVSSTGSTNTAITTSGIDQPGRTRIQSNSSHVGFKGTEALGNGLSAVFQIESQLAVDNAGNASSGNATAAGGTLATRDTFVGLKGGFGEVRIGNLTNGYRAMNAVFDVMPAGAGVAGANGLIGQINTGASINAANGTTVNSTAAGNRYNSIGRSQGIAYFTPVWNGLSGNVFYSSNENKATNAVFPTGNNAVAQTDPHTANAAINYANGPFAVGYSYQVAEDTMLTSGVNGAAAGVHGGSRLASHLFAAAFTFGGATTLSFQYNQNTADFDNPNAATAAAVNQVKNSVWYFGAKHVMGAHEIAAMYANANDGSLTSNATGLANTNAQDRGAVQYGVRYAYNLSKRTSAYAVYSRVNNKANGNYDFAPGVTASQTHTATALAIGAGADPQAFGVGLRHNF